MSIRNHQVDAGVWGGNHTSFGIAIIIDDYTREPKSPIGSQYRSEIWQYNIGKYESLRIATFIKRIEARNGKPITIEEANRILGRDAEVLRGFRNQCLILKYSSTAE